MHGRMVDSKTWKMDYDEKNGLGRQIKSMLIEASIGIASIQ